MIAIIKNVVWLNVPIVFFALLLSSCASRSADNPVTEESYELPRSCNFMTLANNSGLRSECSPQFNETLLNKYQGIAINGPAEVIWPKGATVTDMAIMPDGDTVGPLKLTIAGVLHLPNNLLGKVGSLADQVVLVAVNESTAKSYSGTMLSFGFKGEAPDISAFPELVGQLSLEYFSIDLLQNLNIPIESATYSLYATLGNAKSNTLTVTVKVE